MDFFEGSTLGLINRRPHHMPMPTGLFQIIMSLTI